MKQEGSRVPATGEQGRDTGRHGLRRTPARSPALPGALAVPAFGLVGIGLGV